MRALLMHSDRNFAWQTELPPQSADLLQDLGLEAVLRTMAQRDDFFYAIAQRGLFCSLRDPAAITYRQEALTDCEEHREVARAMYDLAVETLAEKKKIFSWFSQWPDMNLNHAVTVMHLLVRMLRRLRAIAAENATAFRSAAFQHFFSMLLEELDDQYFGEIDAQLERLRFRRGVLISARLGKGNAGTDFALRRSANERLSWSERIFGPRDGQLWFEVHPRDNLVADALGQSTDHILRDL